MRWIIIILTLLCTSSAYALDGQVSVEVDSTINSYNLAPDFQVNIGQQFGDIYRIYIQAERTKESPLFPNSDKNYRLGLQWSYFKNIIIEMGVAYYKESPFVYTKATWSFDTAKKE